MDLKPKAYRNSKDQKINETKKVFLKNAIKQKTKSLEKLMKLVNLDTN